MARALAPGGAPDRRIWNGHAWQEWDSWQDTGLVTFDLYPGQPASLRAECQCVWHGPARPVGDKPAAVSAAVKVDWEKHIGAVTEAMYPVDVADEIDDLCARLHTLLREHPLGTLAALRELDGRIGPLRTVAVARARHRSVSWQKVAGALGVTRQSAWEKYQFAGTPEDVEAAYAKAAPYPARF